MRDGIDEQHVAVVNGEDGRNFEASRESARAENKDDEKQGEKGKKKEDDVGWSAGRLSWREEVCHSRRRHDGRETAGQSVAAGPFHPDSLKRASFN